MTTNNNTKFTDTIGNKGLFCCPENFTDTPQEALHLQLYYIWLEFSILGLCFYTVCKLRKFSVSRLGPYKMLKHGKYKNVDSNKKVYDDNDRHKIDTRQNLMEYTMEKVE